MITVKFYPNVFQSNTITSKSHCLELNQNFFSVISVAAFFHCR